MKMLLAAIVMTIASPAFAQTEAPADAHAQHSPQQGIGGHSQHTGHEGHDMAGSCCEKDAEGKMACCEKMKANGEEMNCCEKSAADTPAADPHTGHGTSKH